MVLDSGVCKVLEHWREEDWPGMVYLSHEGRSEHKAYVPERTCRLSYVLSGSPRVRYACSSCGEWLADAGYDAFLVGQRERRPYRFCPFCGARVEGGVVE